MSEQHTAETDTAPRLRRDVTPQAVEALRLAADAMPISRPGQQWSGAADWLRRRARAFEVALRDAEPDAALCGARHPGACHVPDSTGVCELSTHVISPGSSDR